MASSKADSRKINELDSKLTTIAPMAGKGQQGRAQLRKSVRPNQLNLSQERVRSEQEGLLQS